MKIAKYKACISEGSAESAITLKNRYVSSILKLGILYLLR